MRDAFSAIFEANTARRRELVLSVSTIHDLLAVGWRLAKLEDRATYRLLEVRAHAMFDEAHRRGVCEGYRAALMEPEEA